MVHVLPLWWSTKILTWYAKKPNSKGHRGLIPSSFTPNLPRLSTPRPKISWLLFKDSRVGQAPMIICPLLLHFLKRVLRILDHLYLMGQTTIAMKQARLLGDLVRIWLRVVQLFNMVPLIWILLTCHFLLQIPQISFALLDHQCINILILHMGFWEVWYPLPGWNSWKSCLNIDINSFGCTLCSYLLEGLFNLFFFSVNFVVLVLRCWSTTTLTTMRLVWIIL